MADESKSYSSDEKYGLIGKLIEEVKLRRYSYQTGKSYKAQFCHPSVGIWCRYQIHPAIIRAQRFENNADLHACSE